jgi:hypothetical protein
VRGIHRETDRDRHPAHATIAERRNDRGRGVDEPFVVRLPRHVGHRARDGPDRVGVRGAYEDDVGAHGCEQPAGVRRLLPEGVATDLDEADVVGSGGEAQASEVVVLEPGRRLGHRRGLALAPRGLGRRFTPELTTALYLHHVFQAICTGYQV